MKILHVITTIERGGAEKQLVVLMREQIKVGYEVGLVFLKGNPHLLGELVNLGVTVHTSIANLSWIAKIRQLRVIIKDDYELIHAHLPISELLSSLTHGYIPLVITRHNTEKLIRGKLSSFSKYVAKYVEHQSFHCIAITDSVREFMLREREWYDAGTISTIHYAADPKLVSFPMRKGNLDSLHFLTISRLVPQKDLPTMLRAFAALNKTHNPDRLSIIGDGRDLRNLKSLTLQLEIDENVDWLGKVQETSEAFQKCDVFLLTSKYEGFGLVLLEAMAIGRPILAAANPAVREVLGSDYPGLFEAGNYVQLSNLMKEVRSEDFRKTLVRYLKKRLLNFDSQTTISQVALIYESARL